MLFTCTELFAGSVMYVCLYFGRLATFHLSLLTAFGICLIAICMLAMLIVM